MELGNLQHDYDRIAASIDWLRTHYREQPRLPDVASFTGLSEAHFQRLFSRWAGISPKRFAQYLTLEYAQQVMQESAAVLDVSLRSGLSGPGRLHDLFVTLEAVSPGEFRREGGGIEIGYGEVPTPFGPAAIGYTERGVCHLSFLGQGGGAREAVQGGWPQACLVHRPTEAGVLGERVFGQLDPANPEPVSAWVVGSNFQLKVWRALLQLPAGYLWSYGELASRAGHAGAARAVGTAMAVNPLAYLIPCHRVLRNNGEVGVYHWGSERKALMVAWEAARRHRGRP